MFNINDCWEFDPNKNDTSHFSMKIENNLGLYKINKIDPECFYLNRITDNGLWTVNKPFLLKHFNYVKMGKQLYG